MLSVVISAVFISTIIPTSTAIDYTSDGVISEKLILYDNTRFFLEESSSGNDAVLYMTINDPITNGDNFSVNIVVTRYDGVQFPVPNNPIKLCDLLYEEATNADNPITQFHISRAFNMEGMTCPIPASKKKLMPYMFPPKLSLQNDIGCGTFTYETTIESCQGQKPENCMPFITASTDVSLSGNHCSNTL